MTSILHMIGFSMLINTVIIFTRNIVLLFRGLRSHFSQLSSIFIVFFISAIILFTMGLTIVVTFSDPDSNFQLIELLFSMLSIDGYSIGAMTGVRSTAFLIVFVSAISATVHRKCIILKNRSI